MSPRKTQLLGLAVVAALLGAAFVSAPATATTDSTQRTSSAQMADERLNRTLNGTAVVTATRTADGGLLLGGTEGFRKGNATLTKLAPSGTTEWTHTYNTSNRSGIVAVERGPGDGIYFLQFAYNRTASGFGEYSVWLVGASETGEIQWRQSLNRSGLYGGRDVLAVSETGPALATRASNDGNVSLLQFETDGDLRWNRTYRVDARPQTLAATSDGYLMAGTAGFQHPWVLRTDSAGAVLENRTYEDIEVQQLVGAVPTDDGVVVAGTSDADHRTQHPWAAKLGTDGVPRWNRVYPQSEDVRVRDVLPDEDGITLVGTGEMGREMDASGHLIGVGPDGSQRYAKRIGGYLQTVAVPGPDRHLTVAGFRGYPSQNVTSVIRTVGLPSGTQAQETQPRTPLTSTKTFYRGQDLAVVRPSAAGETIDLVAVPGEHDEFDEHVVRRLELDEDGRTVIESATLTSGKYYLRTDSGSPVRSISGWALEESDRDSAIFELRSHNLYSRETGQTYLDRAAGESNATFTVRSERSNYALYVAADRFRGDQVGAETLREMFGNQSVRIDQFRGISVARIPAHGNQNVTVSVDAVEAGMYDLTFYGADTSEGGAVTDTRIVVGPETPRPVTASLGTDSLSVAVDGEAETNVTVGNATHGIGAMSMSANRTGAPAIDLSTNVDINGTSSQAGASWSDTRSEADAQSFDGDTANGTVVVGTLTVRADGRTLDPTSNATNTVTFGLDWVVDENGVPYTIPPETTVSVEVTNIENATGEYHDRHGAHHPRSEGGSASGSQSVRSS